MGWVSARVPDRVLKEIRRIIFTEGYNDVADYVRDVIRKDFRERGIKMEEGLEEAEKEESEEA
jgi:Arc/MetJ-type ribon-helix-helix transcriptional regulator